MCFYDCYKFECGDYKWGNFRQHCNKEYRMGETCGMRLVLDTIQRQSKCRLCDKIDTKMRKRQAEFDRIKRWQAQGTNPASVEKSYQNIALIDQEIQTTSAELAFRRSNITSQRAPDFSCYHA